MSFVVKGWCPGALRPMMSGDGLVVRVRPQMARLTAVQVRGLANASLAYGSGAIDLTARGNLQLRGVKEQWHLALLDDLDGLGLLDADETVERRRNIVVTPFWVPGDGTAEIVAMIMNVLAAPEFAALPGKFGVTVDLGRPVLQAVSADIRIERLGQGWLVWPDGFAVGALVSDVEAVLKQLLRWFLASGAARMAALRGRVLPVGFECPVVEMPFDPVPGLLDLGRMVGLAFGQMRAETLLNLSNHALRITPWRMILIEGSGPDLPGLIGDELDPLLRVTACTGAPDCPQGLQTTRDLARGLAPLVPMGQHLHVSGCAKGCAHPRAANVTLTATAAGFDLIRDGRADDAPQGVFTTEVHLFKVP